jgi:hypothetical protein
MVTIAKFAWCYIEKPKRGNLLTMWSGNLKMPACTTCIYRKRSSRVFTLKLDRRGLQKKSCYSVLCVQICGAVAALLAFTCHILQNGLLSLMQICTGTVQKLPKPRAIILIPDADHCKHLKPFHFGQNMCCDFPQRCIMCAKDQ